MRSMVTGGAGFIGSNLVDALVRRGDRVSVLDDFSSGDRARLDGAAAAGAAVHAADVRDAGTVRRIAAAERPDVVFHLAAQIDVRRSVADAALDARVNVEGTINVLDAARGVEAARVVYASSGGAIYGEADRLPTPEGAAIRPIAPYGVSKYAAEAYCGLYRELHELSTVSVRYANVYGPRQDPSGEGGVVAIFCGHALAGERATIFGDGTQTRDYVHVDDVVRGTLAAGDGDTGGAFNLGTGVETSVLELVDVLGALVPERPLAVTHAPARPGEIHRSCLEPSLAGSVLAWAPTVPLHAGLKATLDWLRERPGAQTATWARRSG